ncbi:MAG: hypothetical protein K9N47_26955 [Prosthecobacter sp.]|uniref:hypothetical protein n=1 Tax=Prosthecobacter sp. TaxID=1965333 RepID=UPI00260B5D2A|nr:hypothetical protein [Prosthecobacter sp.]MCF7789791.1 hypothetical protein [Prosthecobacter sp.]
MSTLALRIDQALQKLDAAKASELERLVSKALDLVCGVPNSVQVCNKTTQTGPNGFEVVPANGRVVTSALVQQLMESEAA